MPLLRLPLADGDSLWPIGSPQLLRMMRAGVAYCLFWLAAIMAATPVSAQAPRSDAPGAAEPKPDAEQRASSKEVKDTKEVRFDILAYTVEGNTVLSVRQIEAAVYPFLGPERTFADAEAARAALEKAYQDAGYLSVVVTLPPQTVRGGELALKVTEARVNELRITGAEHHRPSDIRAATPSVAEGSVPNFGEVQADLGRVQMRSAGDVQVTPLISVSEAPDGIDVELKVKDERPLHGALEVNNKQAYNTDAYRIEAAVRYDNLFQRGHSIGAFWFYSPFAPSEANTWVANYSIPFASGIDGAADRRLTFVGVWSDSSTPTSIGGATVVDGSSFGVRYSVPMASRADGFSYGFTVGADRKYNKDINQDVAGFTTETPELIYNVLVFGMDAARSSPGGRAWSLDASVTWGPDIWGTREVDCNGSIMDQFACKRAGAQASFATLKLNGQAREPLWMDTALLFRFQSQLASGPLVSSEQFGAGGFSSVRGYYEYEQVGDQGVSFQAELTSPVWELPLGFSLYALAFLDRGWLRVIDPLPAEESRIRLGSYGVGLRAQRPGGLSLLLDYAVPTVNTLKAEALGTSVYVSGPDSPNTWRIDAAIRQTF